MKTRQPTRVKALTLCLSLALLMSCGDSEQARFDQLLAEGESLYSHKKQELIIRHFFRDRRDGFFVDIGCFQPIRGSTTYYLEAHLGWSGIGVDAQEHLRAKWESQRPRSKFFGLAVTDKSGETITFYQAGGFSAVDHANIAKWEKRQSREIATSVLEVSTITLDDLLSREGVQHIDFLSLDINDSEPAALAGFDIKRYRPELVQIEANGPNNEILNRYFEENGYERIDEYIQYDRNNWFFTPRAEK